MNSSIALRTNHEIGRSSRRDIFARAAACPVEILSAISFLSICLHYITVLYNYNRLSRAVVVGSLLR